MCSSLRVQTRLIRSDKGERENHRMRSVVSIAAKLLLLHSLRDEPPQTANAGGSGGGHKWRSAPNLSWRQLCKAPSLGDLNLRAYELLVYLLSITTVNH